MIRIKPYSKRPMAIMLNMLLAFDIFDMGQPTTKSHDQVVTCDKFMWNKGDVLPHRWDKCLPKYL